MANKFLLFLLLFFPAGLFAQTYITGKVYDFENRKTPLQSVLVKNLTSEKFTYTKTSGEFKLLAGVGDLLEFSLNGYHTDTLYLVNLLQKAIYLPVNTTDLKEVEIVGAKINSAILAKDKDIPEFKRFQSDGLRGKKNNDRAGGIKINLGYGRYRKEQEKREALESKQKYESEVDETFNEDFVAKLTKLKDQELKDFMERYRPDPKLVAGDEPFDYTTYTIKAYGKWIKLSPSEKARRTLPKLTRDQK